MILLRRPALSVILALLTASVAAASTAAPKLEDPLANPGFVAFYNNEYDTAIAYFEQQIQEHPGDPSQYNHLAQSLLYREMFRDGALESSLVTGNNPFLRRAKMEIDPRDKQRFANCIDKSIGLSQAALRNDAQDVQMLYALGVAHGLRANYLFLVEKAWIASLREATAARKAHQQILRIDPDFIDAHLILGLDRYIVSCLPLYLRVLGSIGGFHGDKEEGIRELELVAQKGILDRYDAQVLLAAIYRREHRSREALPVLEILARTFPRNYLFRLEQVQMYSDLGNKGAALQVLATIEHLRESDAPGYQNLSPEKVQFIKGNLLFWYGDLDPALANLKLVTKKADELDLNTAVLAWLRLGQVYDLKGNHDEAVLAYRNTVKTAPESAAADEAKGYISSPYHRKRPAA